MVAKILSVCVEGITAHPVAIECDITNGLPSMSIIGLSQKTADGVKERVRSSILNSGLEFPRKRITVNLAPADLPKDGSIYDLPIALSILARSEQIPKESLFKYLVIGELGLDGNIRACRGVLAIADRVRGLNQRLIAPEANAPQVKLVEGISFLPAKSLSTLYRQLVSGLSHIATPSPAQYPNGETSIFKCDVDFSDVIGQDRAKRALEIAAAGGHNVFMSGPPGTGKSMLAKALPGILPAMSTQEVIASTQLHSLVGNRYDKIITSRPFRAPHHSSSHISLVGGGQYPKPGEISLSHNGVLFLDEFPEFSKIAIESLRQPLEDKSISISRANRSITLPADFMLVATSNPCPCGYYGDPKKACVCGLNDIVRYKRKLSGPITDRIDLQVNVGRVESADMLKEPKGESSDSVRKRVKLTRDIQAKRYENAELTNSGISSQYIRKNFKLSKEVTDLLNTAVDRLDLSSRSYFRVIKVARTIADLDQHPNILPIHLSEALQYRLVEPQLNISA